MTPLLIASVLLFLNTFRATSANVVYPRLDYLHPILNQEYLRSPDGRYKFGYESNTAIAQQDRGSDGTAKGFYSYLDDRGQIQHVEYVAGHEGYKVLLNNAMPTYTPEVEAARNAHLDLYNRALKEQTRTTVPSMQTTVVQTPGIQEINLFSGENIAHGLVQTTTTARPLNANPEVKNYVLPSPTVHRYEKIWPLPPLKFKDLSIEVNGQNWYDPRTQFGSWQNRQPPNEESVIPVNPKPKFTIVGLTAHQMDSLSDNRGSSNHFAENTLTNDPVNSVTKSSNDVLHAEKAFEIALKRLKERYNLI